MFSSTVMDHFYQPRNVGPLESPSGFGQVGSRELGRFVQMWIRLEGNRITEACYKTYGCVPAIAAGSCLTEWVQGLTVDEARRLTPEDLVDRLGGLPTGRVFCAEMTVQALHKALDAAEREAA